MVSKMIEIRDRGTFIPALAVLLDSTVDQEAWLLRQAGFVGADHYVLLCKVNGGGGDLKCATDPFDWGSNDRTYKSVHRWLAAPGRSSSTNLEDLEPGQVVDVEVILGEKEVPKVSERFAKTC